MHWLTLSRGVVTADRVREPRDGAWFELRVTVMDRYAVSCMPESGVHLAVPLCRAVLAVQKGI